jgi:hypothetical protein
MGPRPPAWRRRAATGVPSFRPRDQPAGPLLVVLLVVLLALALPPVALADSKPPAARYRCDGEPLTTVLNPGAVDALAIPNSSGGTVPGAFLVVSWRGIQLQLPRTNNAGAPSFSDGKWWWSLETPDHPRFRLRQSGGEIQEFSCERLT